MQPVARRAGLHGGLLPFRCAVQLVGPLGDGPDTGRGDDLVVPDVVDVILVGLVVLVFEQHVVFRVVGRVFDMRRAVHVADQMDDVFQIDRYGRVGQVAVIPEVADRQLKPVNGVALSRLEQFVAVAQVRAHGRRVPVVGEGVFGRLAVFVHPFGVVDDGVPAEILLDPFLGPFGEVAFGDLGDRFVAFAAPRPRRFGSGEGESRRKEQQKQFFHGLDGFGESVFSKKRYPGHRNTSSLCRGAKGRQKLSPSS